MFSFSWLPNKTQWAWVDELFCIVINFFYPSPFWVVLSLFLLMFLISNVFFPVIQMYILVLTNNFFVPFIWGKRWKLCIWCEQLVLNVAGAIVWQYGNSKINPVNNLIQWYIVWIVVIVYTYERWTQHQLTFRA